jgi:multidrug efflux pump
VHADLRPGILPDQVVSALDEPIAALSATLPPGYRIAVGGTVEESAKSQASVLAVVPAMLFIMLTVLMFQLKGFQRLLIVLSVGRSD